MLWLVGIVVIEKTEEIPLNRLETEIAGLRTVKALAVRHQAYGMPGPPGDRRQRRMPPSRRVDNDDVKTRIVLRCDGPQGQAEVRATHATNNDRYGTARAQYGFPSGGLTFDASVKLDDGVVNIAAVGECWIFSSPCAPITSLAEPATIVAPAAFGQRRIDVADRPCGRRHIESVAIVVRWNVCFQ